MSASEMRDYFGRPARPRVRLGDEPGASIAAGQSGNDGMAYADAIGLVDDAIGRHSKYRREIQPGVYVDVYDVLNAWGVRNPALQHMIKKALQPGERGHKTLDEDMDDIVASANRARELVQ